MVNNITKMYTLGANMYLKIELENFRTQNFLVCLETAYIEASLPKWQFVECATL